MNRSAIGHVATALLRRIGTLARIDLESREKTILIVEDVRSVEWASLTFVGERHILDLRIEGEAHAVAAASAAIERDLPEIDLSIPGHFVAEIRAEIRVENRARLHPVSAGAGGNDAGQSLRVEALVLRD